MTDKKHMIIDGQIVNFDENRISFFAVIRKAGSTCPPSVIIRAFHLRRMPHVRSGGRMGRYHRLVLHASA